MLEVGHDSVRKRRRTDSDRTVGWGSTQSEPAGFGAMPDNASIKSKMVNLINSVRTLMSGKGMLESSGYIITELRTVPLIFVNVLIIAYIITLG